jgi:hypothetical protein
MLDLFLLVCIQGSSTRWNMLQEVRKGQLPDSFLERHNKAGRSNVVQLIRWLLHADPSKRPTALEVCFDVNVHGHGMKPLTYM